MNLQEHINNIGKVLKPSLGIVNGPYYSISQRQLGEISYAAGNFLEAIHHFSEAHTVGLRQISVLETSRTNSGFNDPDDPLSFDSNYSKDGVDGMLKRLEEMPSEWTLVQLTRTFDPNEVIYLRSAKKSPKFKDFFLTRYPCGQDLKKYVPVVKKLSWADNSTEDLIEEFLKIQEKLILTKIGPMSRIKKLRQEASLDLEKYCRDIGSICFKEWTCLMLGKLYSKSLGDEIRNIVDKRLDGNELVLPSREEEGLHFYIDREDGITGCTLQHGVLAPSPELSQPDELVDSTLTQELNKSNSESSHDQDKPLVNMRQKYLCYLLAEGCCHLENAELEVATYQIFDNEILAVRVLETLVRIKDDYGGRLHVAKRHPVLLIVDDHLDIISWESLPFLKRHPVSRIYSLQFAHALFRAHRDYIKDGVREIVETDVCYYIVDPDKNLPEMQERMSKFLKKRFPSWIGIVGKKPTEEEFVKALTEPNSYVYCGHGSGSQYLRAEIVQRLNVKPLQLLYGCSSVALRDLGGLTEMYGDVMEYAISKSGCTLGMLWPVTSYDTDKITMLIANTCLPGKPVDIQTFELVEDDKVKKEAELLRALRDVRESVSYFFNGAALIARGIPIKLVQTSKED